MSDGRRDYAILISLSMREEAEVLASALRADGIDAFIGNKHHANVDWGYTIALGGMQVLVPREKLDEAREAIRERIREAAKADDGEPVKRRDRYKVWLVIAGYFALGMLGIQGGVASHQFDEQRNLILDQARFNTGAIADAFADGMRKECLQTPDKMIHVWEGNEFRAVPCDEIDRDTASR